jgi:exonuclease SbcC
VVPLRLELKNFLSYGELQTIDFSEHNLICLSGKNGHGKSAILDAITWALWGQARKPGGTAKPDESLLRLGQTKLLVILEFKIEQQVYRIRREFIKSVNNKSVASLELAITTETGELLPLTEKTIRQTQKKIDSIVKVDFETFINSSFLRQGNANEFSKKSPRERKLLLTKILGFDLYDRMQQKALDAGKEKNLRLKMLATEEKKNDELLKELPVLLEKKQALQGLLDTNKIKLNQTKDSKNKLDEQKQQLNKQIDEIKRIVEQRDEILHAISLNREKFIQIIKKWRNNHHEILKTKISATCKQELATAETELLILEKKLLTKVELTQALSLLKNKLSLDLEALRKTMSDKKENLQKLFFVEEKKETTLAMEAAQLTNNIHKQKLFYEETLNQLVKTQTHCDFLSKELTNASTPQKKIVKIERALLLFAEKERFINNQVLNACLTQTKENKECPTCKQNISEEIKKTLKKKLLASQRKMDHQLSRIKRLQPQFTKKLEHEKNLLSSVTTNNQQLALCESKLTELRLRINQIDAESLALQTMLTKTNPELLLASQQKLQLSEKLLLFEQESKKELEDNTAIIDQKKQVSSIEAKLVELENISAVFTTHKNRLQALRTAVATALETEQKKTESAILKERLSETKNLLRVCLANQKVLEEKLGNTEKFKAQYFELKNQWELTVAAIQTAEQEQNKLYQEFATAEALASIRQNLAKENETIKKEMVSLSEEVANFEILAEAFGKNGIQAFLIEDVIPEIEHTTNQILNLISETQAKVFIEPLRDLKKGGVRESLDITIADINGIRDYEMFSGGEAFRIDFALRIGISQVIAKRSGVNLRTLIIDEGFGALDEEGINLMMNCIYRIATQFEKVIVVSHLPILKEMFPVHLNVTKSSTGSMVSVEYRG